MKSRTDTITLILTAIFGMTILFYAFLAAPAALKMIDEVSYYAAAWSLSERGTLIVENGWDRFDSRALRLQWLIPGPNGLTPQYPPGAAILGAPLLSLWGIRGLIVLNAAAAAATLLVIRAIALRAFGREDVALTAILLTVLASFWVEYAFGIWPHSLSILFVLLAFWAGLVGLEQERAVPAAGWAAAAGLAVGAGMMIRADSILVLPTLVGAAVLIAPRPIVALIGGVAGLAPFLLASGWINAFKFGDWFPLTYGTDSGGVSFSGHMPAIALVAIALSALGLLRLSGWRPQRSTTLLLFGIVTIAIALVPTLRDIAMAYGRGLWGLVVDAKILPGPNLTEKDGLVYFWNLPKKALGQSMPWIGCLVGLALLPMGPRERRMARLLAAAILIWTLPFIMRSWYGGYGSNMRYFLPALPLLAILGAVLWHRLVDMNGTAWLVLGIGCGYALIFALVWTVLHPTGFDGVQQIMSTYVLTASVGIALLAGWAARKLPRAAIATQIMFAMGVGLAASFTVQDLRADQIGRASVARASEHFKEMPQRSIYYGRPELFPGFFARADSFLAMPWNWDRDAAFLSHALDDGYRVFVEPEHLRALMERMPQAIPTSELVYSGSFVFSEIVLAQSPDPVAPDPNETPPE
jgi:4-amino-4-deoxy-L-arabinose transferase-like glycosyltransferase